MLETYLLNLDDFVRRVKLSVVSLGGDYLDGVHYCCAQEDKYSLSYLLFSGLQVLSYVREAKNDAAIKQVVSHILTLIDLGDVGLEPYNLFYRPSRSQRVGFVLWDGTAPIAGSTGGILLGNGVVTTSLTLPSVYEQPLAPTLNSF